MERINPMLASAIFWDAQSAYDKFSVMPSRDWKAAADAASRFTQDTPLEHFGGKLPTTVLPPPFGERTVAYCVALVAAYLVWVRWHQAGADDIPPSPILSAAKDGYSFWLKGKQKDAQRDNPADIAPVECKKPNRRTKRGR